MPLALLLLIGLEPPGPAPLTQVADVRALSKADAAERRPVELTVAVTFVNRHLRDFFVQDVTAGVYVEESPLALGLAPGDRVILTGFTAPGTFAPAVVATGVRKIGSAEFPAPELHNLDPDDNRWLDARYVEGRVYVQRYQYNGVRVLFSVATAKGTAVINVPDNGLNLSRAAALVGSVVRFRGVCNSPRHDPNTGTASAVGRFLVASLDDIEPLPESNGSTAPIPIANVHRGFVTGPAPFARPVAVRGVVTYALEKNKVQEIAVQDDTGAALVYPSEPTDLRVGAAVLVRGYSSPRSSAIRLEHAVVSLAGPPRTAPAPFPTSADQILRDARWGRLVEVAGEVRAAAAERDGEWLVTCTDMGRQFVVAYSGPDGAALGDLEPGTQVTITGVVFPVAAQQEGDALCIRINSPEDVFVRSRPPPPPPESWWTARRVTRLLVGVGVAGLLVGGWILTLRRQVRRQAAEIRARYEREAELSRSLQESRRLEALGRLVGGIAHDFNNLLTVILGSGQLVRDLVPAASPADELLRTVIQAGERGADLTGQLLTFSRRNPIALEPMDLNEVLQEIEKLVRPAVGDGVRVVTDYAPDLPPVRADRGVLTQLVLNLATNARDAMDGAGELGLRTRCVAVAGRPVARLVVSDNGCGMDDATKARVFEPFFTTKPVGKGTGLGLATVYGIVNGLGGTIALESAVGQGTTFSIDLPGDRSAGNRAARATPGRPRPAPAVGPVLLVDDDPSVRATTAAILRYAGVIVVEADAPGAALDLIRHASEPFAVLITDIVMPELSGPQLAEQVRLRCPDIRVLFISGYPREELPQNTMPREGDRFLHKPFAAVQLLVELQALCAGSSAVPVAESQPFEVPR
ncbi:Blue-light-activated protein [Gemmata obscuriglobus]|uniref:histidine kinase n=1 Tax=Gemmata obscuriglobus TaxID=114 RepID=A0A2Z3GTP0_9BACT|nr:ATP-binding protein [Gemmata obscuriglobus]AWM37143.1 hybrid sensor histidine kinase/response regulator [Gemmata obscuriglobus]QEG30128.1 Blue-light-activated protein [Gemmata obscuriglobus]VTS09449.1 histidine kinase : Histidine kinase OS=Chthoniobacter flavus Ellin428 GN=CfE428DRAFT_4011 PE=4 SV=1: HisKA: HATPase_c: Response_reg [Gemmata obscuriglobus UQM 2246]